MKYTLRDYVLQAAAYSAETMVALTEERYVDVSPLAVQARLAADSAARLDDESDEADALIQDAHASAERAEEYAFQAQAIMDARGAEK